MQQKSTTKYKISCENNCHWFRKFGPITLVSEQALSNPCNISSGQERTTVSTHRVWFTILLQHKSIASFPQNVWPTLSLTEVTAQKGSLAFQRMRPNLSFIKLPKMRWCNIAEGERGTGFLSWRKRKVLPWPFLAAHQEKQRKRPRRLRRHQRWGWHFTPSCVPRCPLPPADGCSFQSPQPITRMSSYTSPSKFHQMKHKSIVFVQLTPKHLLTFLVH